MSACAIPRRRTDYSPNRQRRRRRQRNHVYTWHYLLQRKIRIGTTRRANVAAYGSLFLSRRFAPKLITNGVVVSSYPGEKARSGPLLSSYRLLLVLSFSITFSLSTAKLLLAERMYVISRYKSWVRERGTRLHSRIVFVVSPSLLSLSLSLCLSSLLSPPSPPSIA